MRSGIIPEGEILPTVSETHSPKSHLHSCLFSFYIFICLLRGSLWVFAMFAVDDMFMCTLCISACVLFLTGIREESVGRNCRGV